MSPWFEIINLNVSVVVRFIRPLSKPSRTRNSEISSRLSPRLLLEFWQEMSKSTLKLAVLSLPLKFFEVCCIKALISSEMLNSWFSMRSIMSTMQRCVNLFNECEHKFKYHTCREVLCGRKSSSCSLTTSISFFYPPQFLTPRNSPIGLGEFFM